MKQLAFCEANIGMFILTLPLELKVSSRSRPSAVLMVFSLQALSMTNVSLDGTSADVVRITRQILNRSSANRTIPKQEVCTEVGELPLTLSTEVTETVNLSGSYKLSSDTHADLVNRYRRIAKQHPNMSLHDFVKVELNTEDRKIRKKYVKNASVIPHYVGANGHDISKPYIIATTKNEERLLK